MDYNLQELRNRILERSKCPGISYGELTWILGQIDDIESKMPEYNGVFKKYKDAIDKIYNHSDECRKAVVKYFGTLHPTNDKIEPKMDELGEIIPDETWKWGETEKVILCDHCLKPTTNPSHPASGIILCDECDGKEIK